MSTHVSPNGAWIGHVSPRAEVGFGAEWSGAEGGAERSAEPDRSQAKRARASRSEDKRARILSSVFWRPRAFGRPPEK